MLFKPEPKVVYILIRSHELASVNKCFSLSKKVCQSLKKDNWTVERDGDMTGPYAFDEKNHWLAFDDATSLKIKTKYALLRNLAGVGLYSIDADDVDNLCGNGAFSLLRSIHATLSHLDRRPRQLIVHR